MNFIRAAIPDIIIINPKVYTDDRGYFTETFRTDLLNDFLGFKVNFVQDNESQSTFGVLRGLHYQLPPFAQTKLVRVIKGAVLDIAVDMRSDSSTFGKYVSIELNEDNKTQIFIPRGFAHGFVVLSEMCTFAYKVDAYYNANYDFGVMYNDTILGIDWRLQQGIFTISDKDKRLPNFLDATPFTNSKELYA